MAPLFPVNNVWNIAVDGLSPSRALDVTNDHAGHDFHPDFGTVIGGTTLLNGIPINFVAGNSVTPRLVNVGAYYQESDVIPGGTNQTGYLPIPTSVVIEGDPTSDGAWSSGADHHICLVDTDTNTLHELYSAIREIDGSISTSWYGRWDLGSNDLRHDFWTSGDAAGLPVAPGLVRYDEVQAALAIDATGATVDLGHALRFTLDLTHGPHIWPARHDADSGSTDNPPFGMRVRLKSTFSSSGYSATNKVIINTLKKYGAFLADNGGDWYFQGTPNAGWNDSDLHNLSAITPSDDMEVVDISNWQVFDYSAEADIAGDGLPALPYPRASKLLAIDFDDAGAIVTAPGWTSFTTAVYNASPGYGWVSSSGLDYRTRSGTDTFWRDFVLGDSSGTHTFRYDVANGQYVVTVFLGDPENLHNEDLVIVTNGVTQETIPYTVTGERLIQSYLVTVAGGYLSIGFTVSSGGSLCIAGLEVDPVPTLSLSSTGTGNDEKVTIESEGQFRLIFDAGDNWGCGEWYDLVNDPDAERNLTGPALAVDLEPTTGQPGIFNQTFYSTTPNDCLTFTRSAYNWWPSSARSFEILENTPTRMKVRSTCHPMIGTIGVLTDVTVRVTYTIYPEGAIHIICETTAASSTTIAPWFQGHLGLENPGGTGTSPPDVTGGWVRATPDQNPWSYSVENDAYLFAYWDTTTPPPNTNFAKASVMLVPKTSNPHQGIRIVHSWTNFIRWGYGLIPEDPITIGAGQTVTQQYLIQLGTEGSLFLPDIKTSTVADPIAAAYQVFGEEDTGDPAGIPTGSFGYKLVMG